MLNHLTTTEHSDSKQSTTHDSHDRRKFYALFIIKVSEKRNVCSRKFSKQWNLCLSLKRTGKFGMLNRSINISNSER